VTKQDKIDRLQKLEFTFGVEIECYPPQLRASEDRYRPMTVRTAQMIEDAVPGITIAAENYNHQTRRYWKVVPDGSLRSDGVEIVSPILHGEQGLEILGKVLTALRDSGHSVDTSTGIHVHMGLGHAKLNHIKSFLKLYVRYEHVMDYMMGRSRRGNNNRYCASHSRGGQKWEMDDMFNALKRSKNMTQVQDALQPNGSRYTKLNLHAWSRQRTLEIRHFGGSLNATKVKNWILLLDAMWRQAQIHTVVAVYNNVTKPAESAYSFFTNTLSHEPELADYWHSKVREMVKQERRRQSRIRRNRANGLPSTYGL
jgi:hypothetical protein